MGLSLVTDFTELSKLCKPVTFEAGTITGNMLVQYLKEHSGDWMGIAANQLGINQRVCAVTTVTANAAGNRFFYLINPEITKSEGKFRFEESCLSFPGKTITTTRFKHVYIKCDNMEGSIYFYADPNDWQQQAECACIQHEIDHLNGITMFKRIAKPEQYIRSTERIGRNDLCFCGSGKKYKRCCLKLN